MPRTGQATEDKLPFGQRAVLVLTHSRDHRHLVPLVAKHRKAFAAQARPERFGGSRQAPDEIGDHWRAQPGPEVLERGLEETLGKGGGWCIIPTEADTADKVSARHEAQRAGLFDYAAQREED